MLLSMQQKNPMYLVVDVEIDMVLCTTTYFTRL